MSLSGDLATASERARTVEDTLEAHGLEALTSFDSRASLPNDFPLLSSEAARAAVVAIPARPYFGG